MSISSYFFNALFDGVSYDREYNAEDFSNYLDGIVGNGVFPNPSTQLQVRAGSGMNVIVGAGNGWIFGHKMVNSADLTLAIGSSDVLLNRIDAVVFYLDYDNRTMGIAVKEGTAAATPVAPSLQRNASKYEMCLAQISVPKQATAVTAAQITDTRMNSDLCGFVQGLVQQVSTTTLFTQWQAQFEQWFEGIQAEFAAGNLFKQYEGVRTVGTGEFEFDVSTYVPYYNYSTDVLNVFVDGIRKNTNDYTLVNGTVVFGNALPAGSVITFVVLKLISIT